MAGGRVLVGRFLKEDGQEMPSSKDGHLMVFHEVKILSDAEVITVSVPTGKDVKSAAMVKVEAPRFVRTMLAVNRHQAALNGHGDDVPMTSAGVGILDPLAILGGAGALLRLALLLGGFLLLAASRVKLGLLPCVFGLLLRRERVPLCFAVTHRE